MTKYITIVVVTTEEKVTKKAITEMVEKAIEAASTDKITVQRAMVRSVDFD